MLNWVAQERMKLESEEETENLCSLHHPNHFFMPDIPTIFNHLTNSLTQTQEACLVSSPRLLPALYVSDYMLFFSFETELSTNYHKSLD